MNIKSTIAQWRSFLLQGKQVIPEKSMVLGMSLRFRPPLKHPPAAQFEIQIRDSRIQMITRSNSFPSIKNLGRRFCQQIECKSRHSHLHEELYYSWVILRDCYICRDSRIKRRRQLMSKFCQFTVIFKYSKIPTWLRSFNYTDSNLRYNSSIRRKARVKKCKPFFVVFGRHKCSFHTKKRIATTSEPFLANRTTYTECRRVL